MLLAARSAVAHAYAPPPLSRPLGMAALDIEDSVRPDVEDGELLARWLNHGDADSLHEWASRRRRGLYLGDRQRGTADVF